MARVAPKNADLLPPKTPASVLQAVDGWLRDAAIRRTLLAAFLVTLLATLAAVVLIATLGSLAVSGLAAIPTAGMAYSIIRRRPRPGSRKRRG